MHRHYRCGWNVVRIVWLDPAPDPEPLRAPRREAVAPKRQWRFVRQWSICQPTSNRTLKVSDRVERAPASTPASWAPAVPSAMGRALGARMSPFAPGTSAG